MKGERLVVIVVVGFIGLFTIIGLVAVAWLAFVGHEVPDGLYTLTGTGLGALGSMLVRTSGNDPMPVTNEDDETKGNP